MDAETTRRRIKAARTLAGFDSADALAEQLRDQGLGPRTVRKIESGERPVRPMELREIARVCDVPFVFFEVEDLSAALQLATDARDLDRSLLERGHGEVLEEMLDQVRGQLALIADAIGATRIEDAVVVDRDQENEAPLPPPPDSLRRDLEDADPTRADREQAAGE